MELLAYHRWLLREAKGDQKALSALILKDLLSQNEQAFDLIALTGDEKYSQRTLKKAANLLLLAEDSEDKKKKDK
jgi:hypothetical protein